MKSIDLSRAPLSGRCTQLKILQDALDSLNSEGGSSSADGFTSSRIATVYIEAPSGVGKSFLVESWHHQQQHTASNTTMVSGKFDLKQQSTQPYSAIIHAINELCYTVDTETLRQHIKNDLTGKLRVLIDVIPYLQDIAAGCSPYGVTVEDKINACAKFDSDSEQSSGDDMIKCSTEFNEAIRSLLRLITKMLDTPFVMFIDDIQWADENSLDVLKALMVASDVGAMLLVLASRPVEEDRSFIEQAERSLTALGRPMHKMYLTSLAVTEVNDVLSTILEQSTTATLHLAEIVHEKTNGNPFFVMQYMQLLQRRKLIQYSMTTYCWCWDEREVQSQTDFTDNVADVVLGHIQAMDEDTQRILQYASHLGSTFQLHDLAFLVRGMEVVKEIQPLDEKATIDGVEQRSNEVAALLQPAVAANLVDNQGGLRFKFSHDSVQQSFLELEVDSIILYRIGVVMRCMYESEQGKDWMQFAAVQALNEVISCITDAPSRLILVHMNLHAAQNATSNAAFFPASDHLSHAIKCVQLLVDPWRQNYELMILLYTKAIYVACACGRHQLVESLSEVIFEESQQFEDTVQAHISLALSLQAQLKVEDGFQVLLKALRHLGEKIPTKPGRLSLARSAQETKKVLKDKTDFDILSMAAISDKTSKNAMKLLSMAFLNAYQRYSTDWMLFIMRRLVCKTIQLGLSKYAPLAFAVYAEQLAKEGDFDVAFRFGRVAKFIINQLHVKQNLPVTTYFLAVYVEHLKSPMFQSLRTLDRAFKVGMELGDTQGAFLCATTSMSFKVSIGSPLGALKQEATMLCHNAKSYNQDNIVPEFLLVWQYAAKLQGKTADPLVLDGVTMSDAEIENMVISIGGASQFYSSYLEMMRFAYMGEWEKAEVPLNTMHSIFAANPRMLNAAHYNVPLLYTFAGVIWYKRYSKSKQRAVLRKTKFALTRLRMWASKGALNVVTGLWFVEAQQQAATSKDTDAVKKLFDKTISGLHRCGLRSLEALAWESFAGYAIENGKEMWAMDYMHQARALYNEFGALAKVRQLERDHGALIANRTVGFFKPLPDIRMFEKPRGFSALWGNRDIRKSTWWDSPEDASDWATSIE